MLRRILLLNHRINACSSIQMVCSSNQSRFSSSSSSAEMPQMYHLEHIQKRLEHTVPLMFRARLDFTFYRNDVICEDQIFNTQKIGLQNYMWYLGKMSVAGQIAFPYIKMVPLSINLIQEEGSVRLRWRIAYMNWLSALNWKSYNAEYREKNARWYDGNATFYADGNGLVYKVVISRMSQDDSFTKKSTKKLVEKMGILPQAPTNFVKADHQMKKDGKESNEKS